MTRYVCEYCRIVVKQVPTYYALMDKEECKCTMYKICGECTKMINAWDRRRIDENK